MRALVVEDDPTFRAVLEGSLQEDHGDDIEVATASTLEDARRALETGPFDLLVLDLVFPATREDEKARRLLPDGGRRVLGALKERGEAPRTVVISSQEREVAVRLLLEHTIQDFLFKDTGWDEIQARLGAQVEEARKAADAALMRRELGRPEEAELVGEDPAFLAALTRADKVAAADTSVLITGESGTGKELVAARLHAGSARATHPFVVVNCAALSEQLFESELFGHRRGSFTGALEDRVGRFELAHRGTLFLDEIGEIPLHVQPKLLRVLQEQTFERVGESRTRRVDVRVVSATNRDLERECQEGRFRLDLLYRLNVFTLKLPPLRQRPADIPLLARHFLSRLGRKLGRRIRDLSPGAEALLRAAPWPGNIRQLRNTIEAAMILEDSDTLTAASLPSLGGPPLPDGGTAGAAPDLDVPYQEALDDFERRLLRAHLAASAGHVGVVAEKLSMQERTLRNRLKKLELDPREFRPSA